MSSTLYVHWDKRCKNVSPILRYLRACFLFAEPTLIIPRLSPQYPISETAAIALLYTKFTSFAFPLRPLLAELELRAAENPTELGSLLDDCHSAWISVRKSLISPRVEREVKRMEPATAGIVDLVSQILHGNDRSWRTKLNFRLPVIDSVWLWIPEEHLL